MKKTRNLWMILAVLLFAASCQNSDVDGGQAINNGKLNLTATIVTPDATRVTYDVDNETEHNVTPTWSVDDEIIGWDDQGQTFTFTVTAVDGSGNATLDAGSYVPGAATKLYAIYAPGKKVSDFGGSGSSRTLAVDLSAQTGVLDGDSPVLMCATAEITAGSASLAFTNQTAIIGVTKFKLPAAATVTSISVDGLITSGTFEVDGGGNLVLTPAAPPATATATGSWATGDGNICTTAIYFATMPTTSAKIALRASDGANDYGNLASIAATNVVAGNYYYMAKNLGAPVADVSGVKYGTLEDAFAAANRATSATTITLLDDCTATGVLRINTDTGGTGDVTLDLGTHTITGYTSGSTINVTDRNLTVTGTTGKITSASTGYYVLYVAGTGTATVAGGNLQATGYRTVYCGANATVYITGGYITSSSGYAVFDLGHVYMSGGEVNTDVTGTSENPRAAIMTTTGGYLQITGGTLTSSEAYTAGFRCYEAGSVVEMSGGTINARWGYFQNKGSNTVRITGGSITGATYAAYLNHADAVSYITGGAFENTTSNPCLYAQKGTLYVSGGYVISGGINPAGKDTGTPHVTGGCFNKPIQPQFATDSESNVYVNVLNPDPATAETYPFTVSPASSTPKVATVTQGSYTWENGSFESALKNADVRAAANGNSTVTMDTDCDASSTSYVSSANTYNVVLDLNGHTVSSTASPAISSAGKFILQDSGSGGELATSGAVALEITSGTATINSGSLYGETNAASVSSGASLVINGGHIWGNGAADITGIGTATVYGGYYRYDPTSLCAASAAASGVTESFGGRTYNYQVVAVVATVNGVGYSTLAAAADAAVAYDGSDPKVTLQLQDNVTHNAALNLTHASKPVVLDLNGHILSTNCVNFIKPESGTLTITDSQNKVGKITTSSYQVVYWGGSTTFTISNCIIEGTMEEASAIGSEMLMLAGGSSSNATISGARIYTRGKQTVLRLNNANCHVTIGADSELSSGIDSEDSFLAIAHNDGYLTIDSGSFYSKNNSVIQHTNTENQNMTTTINGGYFYSGADATYCLRANRGRTDNGLVLNGGYMSKAPSGSKVYYGTGKSLQDCSVTHTHETTGALLTYTKVVAD